MTPADPGGRSEFNARIIAEFRASGGRVSGPLAGTPMLLLHHIGARSGVARITPLACSPRGGGRFAVVAANGGSRAHPGWYYNLKANPRVTVEVGTETFPARAAELDGAARAKLWPALVAESPSVGEFQARTARRIPVVMLTRLD